MKEVRSQQRHPPHLLLEHSCRRKCRLRRIGDGLQVTQLLRAGRSLTPQLVLPPITDTARGHLSLWGIGSSTNILSVDSVPSSVLGTRDITVPVNHL